MQDFLRFRFMITTLLIEIIFWVGVTLTIIGGIIAIAQGATASYGGGSLVLGGLITLLLGPIVVRIICELIIVVFRINGTLTEIRNFLDPEKQAKQP